MNYRIIGDDFQQLECLLESGESVKAEPGAMLYMCPEIEINTKIDGGLLKGLGRKLTGETFFIPSFINKSDKPATIGFSAHQLGKIMALSFSNFQNRSIIAQKTAFLCATSDVNTLIQITKLSSGLFGGEGFLLQKFTSESEDGKLFITSSGNLTGIEMNKGDVLILETGALVAFEDTINYDIQMVKGLRNIFFGGEGLFLTKMTCVGERGKVYIQSVPIQRLSDNILFASRRFQELLRNQK